MKKKSKKQTVLITGGAGFIGSHLCDHFLERGANVICVDNFLTGSLKNIEHHLKDRRFFLVEHDISKPIRFKTPIDSIFHFASPASPVDYLKHPIKTLKVGSLGTHNALGLAKAKGARFTLASTSEVYGDPEVHPQVETYWGHVNPIGPRGVYDEAKRFAEALSLAYKRTHRLDVKIVRIFNTYGPRMRLNDGRVVPAFIGQALQNKPLTVFGDGSQTRSFCYCSDLIEGIYRLMMSAQVEPVNIGNPHEWTVLEFAKEIIRRTGAKSKIVLKPLPEDDPRQRKPDIKRARKMLAWEPEVSLAKGLGRTIAYFRKKVFRGKSK